MPSTRRDRTGPLAPLANLVFGVFALGHGMADIRLTLGAHGNGFSPLVVGAPHASWAALAPPLFRGQRLYGGLGGCDQPLPREPLRPVLSDLRDMGA